MEIRTYRPGDCLALAELFWHTVHTVNAADYTAEQLEAWAPEVVNLDGWDRSFREHHTLLAVEGETVLGFGDMDGGGTGGYPRLHHGKAVFREAGLQDPPETAGGAAGDSPHKLCNGEGERAPSL